MKDRIILGLHFNSSDPSATLIVNDEIVAIAEEERFSQIKHAFNQFPSKAISYCLSRGGINVTDIDCIAIGRDVPAFPTVVAEHFLQVWQNFKPIGSQALKAHARIISQHPPELFRKQLEQQLFRGIDKVNYPEIIYVRHHLAHACSAYMLSEFANATVVTADARGEVDATNIWSAEGDKITHIQEWNIPSSLGWYYTKFTSWFGFEPHDGEGKLMGLAAYGEYKRELDEKVQEVLHLTGDNNVYAIGQRFFLGEFTDDNNPYTEEWISMFGQPRSVRDDSNFSKYHQDLAFAVQLNLEKIGLALVAHGITQTGFEKVCLAGGTFMNCKLNGKIAQLVGPDNLFVQPLAGDNGISLGAALAVYLSKGWDWSGRLNHTYYGPEYSDLDIGNALDKRNLRSRKSQDIAQETATQICNNKVVGWFQGRMEAGMRALGNRSILANPKNPLMKDIINKKVKFREPWRPFCPSILDSEYQKYSAEGGELPFMIVATDALDGVKDSLPSVVHHDNTMRPQIVRKNTNPLFYELIEFVKQLQGDGVILNTSLNLRGKPIACTPDDAIDVFLNSEMDVLVMGSYIIEKASTNV
ncbi:MAG: hypothetical protein HY863_19980 [Chloroflexi bacterium]|nr:hypothetical protein [Chloroflexota bacterium]